MRTAPFYVYALADPRTDEVFYVGKGRGRRAWAHERDVRRGRIRNGPKSERIGSILDVGLTPVVRFLAQFADEESAYSFEKATIAELRGRLLNANCGGAGGACGPHEKQAAARAVREARELLARIIPFGAWCELREPSVDDAERYHRIRDALTTVAAGESLSRRWVTRA